MKAQVDVRLNFRSTRHRDIASDAILPETRISTARSRVRLREEEQSLVLIIKASDTVALRSALNTYLRWAKSISDIAETLDAITS